MFIKGFLHLQLECCAQLEDETRRDETGQDETGQDETRRDKTILQHSKNCEIRTKPTIAAFICIT